MSWSNLNQELLTLSSTFQSIVVNGMDFSDRPYREILYMSKLSCGSNKISDYLNQAFNIIIMLYVHWFWWLKMILYIFSTHWHYLSIYIYIEWKGLAKITLGIIFNGHSIFKSATKNFVNALHGISFTYHTNVCSYPKGIHIAFQETSLVVR